MSLYVTVRQPTGVIQEVGPLAPDLTLEGYRSMVEPSGITILSSRQDGAVSNVRTPANVLADFYAAQEQSFWDSPHSNYEGADAFQKAVAATPAKVVAPVVALPAGCAAGVCGPVGNTVQNVVQAGATPPATSVRSPFGNDVATSNGGLVVQTVLTPQPGNTVTTARSGFHLPTWLQGPMGKLAAVLVIVVIVLGVKHGS